MNSRSDYFPPDEDADNYIAHKLWAAGEDQEQYLDWLHRQKKDLEKSGKSKRLAAGKKPSDFDQESLEAGTKVEMREHGLSHKVGQRIAEDHLVEDKDAYKDEVKKRSIKKALPKKSKSDKPVKKHDAGKASSKKAGKTGKTRYGYPQDKDKKPAAAAAKPAEKKPTHQDPIPVPDEEQPVPKVVDPAELANQLGMSVATLQRIAQPFVENPKMGGRDGFKKFMTTHLKPVAKKHNLDGDYFSMLFDSLTGQQPSATQPAK